MSIELTEKQRREIIESGRRVHGPTYMSKSAGAKAETAKHTPGPWKARENLVYAPDSKTLVVASVLEPEYAEANAKLIAAAPELLEALRNAMGILATIRNDGYAGIALPQLDWILDGDETGDSTAMVALEKATGE